MTKQEWKELAEIQHQLIKNIQMDLITSRIAIQMENFPYALQHIQAAERSINNALHPDVKVKEPLRA